MDDISTTTVAQIATTPILLANFGFYNPLSVIVNVLILWTVPFLMLIGTFAAISSFIFEPLATPLLYLAAPMLWYFKLCVTSFGSLDIGEHERFSLGVYCGILLFTFGNIFAAY